MTIEELKKMKIWFLWNNVLTAGNSKKMTKVPISSTGGKTGTDDSYKNTWSTYDETVLAKERLGASGIGFKVPKGFYFLDVDQRDLDDSFVKRLLKRYGSYAEISPSGKGIHILGICDSSQLPLCYDEKKQGLTLNREFYQKNPNNHVELYIGDVTNRYATFTGNTINNLPIKTKKPPGLTSGFIISMDF